MLLLHTHAVSHVCVCVCVCVCVILPPPFPAGRYHSFSFSLRAHSLHIPSPMRRHTRHHRAYQSAFFPSLPLSYPLSLLKERVLLPLRPPPPPPPPVDTHIRVCVQPGRVCASIAYSHAINIILCAGASVCVYARVYVRMCTCVCVCV